MHRELNCRIGSLGLGAAGLLVSALAANAVPILYNTGLFSENSLDLNYAITSDPSEFALVQSRGGLIGPGKPWIDHLANAKWISPYNPAAQSLDPYETDQSRPFSNPEMPNGGSSLGHIYSFRTVVGGSGSGVIEGVFAADNGATISVNGVLTPFISSGYGYLSPFSLHLTAGDIVEFSVLNLEQYSGNPAGLLVQATTIPDHGMTLGLLASGLAGPGYLRHRITQWETKTNSPKQSTH